MGKRAKAGGCLQTLVKMAVPLLRRAEAEHPRTGPNAQTGCSGLGSGHIDYDRCVEKKKEQIGPVPIPSAASPQTGQMAGNEEVSPAQHHFSSVPPWVDAV